MRLLRVLCIVVFFAMFLSAAHALTHGSLQAFFRRSKSSLSRVALNANKAPGSAAGNAKIDISESAVKYPNFSFEIDPKKVGKARLGLLKTPHGNVETPNFVFCATKAAMKAITPEQLKAEGTQFILSNTYHLMVTPGSEIIETLGGLQKYTNWRGPMLTDSGGYQIFSMGFGSVSNEIKGKQQKKQEQTLIKIDEEGAVFRSYVDGLIHHLSPERSMVIQKQLGADLIVVLDECTPFNVEKTYTMDSMRRSHRWALRSLREFKRTDDGKQALYGIVQVSLALQFSILVVSCLIWSGALDSSGVLLSYHVTSLALPMTNILILTLF